jgi:hypothetical protein
MKVVQHRPAARGVNQLMYVGDAPTDTKWPSLARVGVVVAAVWLILR